MTLLEAEEWVRFWGLENTTTHEIHYLTLDRWIELSQEDVSFIAPYIEEIDKRAKQ